MRLFGKIALVTGASRGIGRAIAKSFAHEGAKVAINYYKSEKKALSLLQELQRMDASAITLKADVSKADQVKKMVHETVGNFDRIDILVNNAGILARTDFLNSTEEIWERTMGINLKGAYLCAKEIAPRMLNQKSGKIINISSVSGLAERSANGNTPYAVSKAGMIGLTRSLAVNLGPYINVNAICPGFTDTDIVSSTPPEKKKLAIEESLLKRIGEPEEIANAVLFLGSDESNFITGEVLTVSGGRAIR